MDLSVSLPSWRKWVQVQKLTDRGKPFFDPVPRWGTVLPGRTLEVRVTLAVDEVWAGRLSMGEEMGGGSGVCRWG
jgi:hypothetical protein